MVGAVRDGGEVVIELAGHVDLGPPCDASAAVVANRGRSCEPSLRRFQDGKELQMGTTSWKGALHATVGYTGEVPLA